MNPILFVDCIYFVHGVQKAGAIQHCNPYCCELITGILPFAPESWEGHSPSSCNFGEVGHVMISNDRGCIQVEGRCDGEYGYIVSVVQITEKSQGMLEKTTGHAAYTVTYTCLVLRPFRGEVMDVLVTSVSKVRYYSFKVRKFLVKRIAMWGILPC